MDTESRYLRDIRDAIKGIAKRSGMDVSGNAKTKYLKEIADAIRENGGGGHDGNDKVKQTPVVTTEQSFDSYNVLLSGSNTNFSSSEITEGARKSPGFEYHADKTQLLVRNKECNVYGYTNKPNIGIFYGEEVDHVYSSKGAMLLTDDVSLSGTGNTWDGVNTSLKSALAACGGNGLFILTATPAQGTYDLTYGEYEVDTTFSDAVAAINAGKMLWLKVVDPGDDSCRLFPLIEYMIDNPLSGQNYLYFKGENAFYDPQTPSAGVSLCIQMPKFGLRGDDVLENMTSEWMLSNLTVTDTTPVN